MAFLGAAPIDLEYLATVDWWQNVEVGDPDECWPWLKSVGSHRYGQTWDRVTVRLAHRVAWALHHGRQVPDGMTIDHECRNRVCCNPAHLRPMTNIENARDNGPANQTHCKWGHPFDDANTLRDGKGHRRCRQCTRNYSAWYKAEHKKRVAA
jgi:hypothetical protein